MDHRDHSQSSVKVAVVGSGYWGKNHVRVFNELGALSQVCDADCDTLGGINHQYPGITCTRRYEDVLANPEIDGIVIATPAVTHYQLAVRAMEAGKDVLVEKPLALRAVEGQKLVRLASDRQAVLMVGHILLYHPAVLKLKEMVDSGQLGKIQHIQSSRLSLGKVRTEENILWSFAPHDISVILFLLGEFPGEIEAVGYDHLQNDVEDVTVTSLGFPSGASAHIYVSWMNPFKEQRLVAIGDRKMALFQDSSPEKKLQLFDHTFQWIRRQPVPLAGDVETVEFVHHEPLKMECQHFLESVRTRSKPRSDGAEGLRVLEVLERCYHSLRKRRFNGRPQHTTVSIEPNDFFVHESALVDDPCSIGKGTKIWHFSHVMEKAQIGENCNVGQNVVIGKGVRIGNKCKIQNNVSIYEGVTLEDFVFCGPSMVFTNVHNPRCEIPRMKEIRPTLVKRGATIGANATIVCGNTIGEYAFIGAGAVVTGDVENYALMMGNPARRVGWMCRCGTRLEGDHLNSAAMQCPVCGDGYVPGEGGLSRDGGRAAVTAVPLLDLKQQYLSIKGEVKEAVNRVMDSQMFILGPEVEALEKEIAEYCGCRYAVGVSSGTDAILVALMALGISPGDEVITTPFTFFATVGCVLRVGASPVFVDIRTDTFNIDPSQIEKAITPRTKAILPVHLFGQAADMKPILDIANKHGIPVIEDAAQAIGTEYSGRKAGSMGTCGCFSFFPSKNLGAFGDGGIITTNDEALAARIRVLRNQGAEPKYHHKEVGGNFRLDALQATVLRVKLNHLESWTEKRRHNAAYYYQRFEDLGLAGAEIVPPPVIHERHIYNQYVIRAENRDGLKDFLKAKGVATEIYYPKCIHLQECMNDCRYTLGDFPIGETASTSVLALPIYPELSVDQKEYVVKKIAGFYGK